MSLRTFGAMALTMLALSGLAREASADVPPPDICAQKDAACNNAGPKADQKGTCQAAKCSRATPGGGVQYDCFLCIVEQGGGGGAGGMSAGGTQNAATGGKNTGAGTHSAGATADPASAPDSEEGTGCSIGTVGSETRVAAVMLMVGFVALGWSRRKR